MNTSTGGAHLHSRYNPQAEAARYIDSLNLKNDTECFILIEPGLGYITGVLRERFDKSKIIALHVSGDFKTEDASVSALYTTEKAEVYNFLERELPQTDAKRIRIIEWRPSLNYYKEDYVKLLSAAVEFIKRIDAEDRTTAAFGKRWVKNFFKNLKLIKYPLLYKQSETPVIITGSGPGLEQALPAIYKMKNNCLIIAASSSLMPLTESGINPDLIITTDGTNWAPRHLHANYRTPHFSIPLAVTLTAALPSQCGDTLKLLINDGSCWQSIVLKELNLPSVIISQKGTVTAAAIELAFILSNGNIYLAGLDLSINDIITHAKPYAFDTLLSVSAGRFNPIYSKSFTRSRQMKEGGSLNIYASWFKTRLEKWPKKIFSLTESRVFENLGSEPPPFRSYLHDQFKTIQVNEDPSLFCKKAADALTTAIKSSDYAENIKKELTPLLFPGENKITDKDLQTAIEETANRYEQRF